MALKIIKIFCFPLVFILLAGGCFAGSSPSDVLRVAVLKDADNFVLSIHGPYRLLNLENGQELSSGRHLKKSRVLARGKGIHIGKSFYSTRQIRIITEREARIYVPSQVRRYRGNLDVSAPNGKLLVVNQIGLEDYVKGVLYHEVSSKWPMEAMKVQAVATRTYALYQKEQNKTQPYDVTSDIYSQVYGGRSAERYRTNIAVDKTNGEILMYNGKILPAYFHAHCGGHTEDVKNLWKHDDLSPLRGVRCPFCARAPNAQWKKNFRLKDIQDKLNANGYALGLIKEIKILSKNKSGRIRTLKIEDRDGQSITISGKDFRNIIGPNQLKSNKYDIVMQGYYMDVVGQGWGHGVGLCQWGANFMAQKRYKYKEILMYYYPGARIVKR